MMATLEILRLGQRGEGVAAGPVYVPYSLPGERVLADVEADRGHMADLLRPSPERIDPICPYFGTCGGCAVQHAGPALYAGWKRNLLVMALSMARVEAPVSDLVPAHGAGRRRATFHVRERRPVNVLAETAPAVGFMQARAHDIVDIAFCPILAPEMSQALEAARAVAAALAPVGKPLDILVTATETGLDVDVRGCGRLDPTLSAQAIEASGMVDCARLSNHGETLIERRIPDLTMGRARVSIPAKSFLQATRMGEEVLAREVLAGVGPARRVLDLFSGVGTFALRLADRATVHAADLEAAPLKALARAAGSTAGLRPVTVETRDLFRRPFSSTELTGFDAVVFDPPRSGAAGQVAQLAASQVPTVVAVSCNPASFARDAATLLAGGYRVERIVPVDQFIYSAHVEVVGVFRRQVEKAKRRRSLLS